MNTYTCTQCGKSFKRKPSDLAKTEKPFCGFACYGAWQSAHNVGRGRKRVQVSCDTCGKAIEKQPSAVSEHNFCGRACFHAWHEGRFSGANNAMWLGGGANYRGPNWNRQRKAARLRDNDTCQRCGISAPSLPVHHKTPFHLFDDYRTANDLSNLETLCPACHSAADIVFWRLHPELVTSRRFPDCAPVVACRKCRKDFTPRSGATVVCDACCTVPCEHCGKSFYSRKAVHRVVKYCSKPCRNAAIKAAPAPEES